MNLIEKIKDLQYFPYRFWNRTWKIRHYPKHAYWHMTKGFCNCETWSLYAGTAEYLLPRLKYLKDNSNGTPQSMFDLPTHEKIAAKAFELYQERIASGEDGSADEDWQRAEINLISHPTKEQHNLALQKWKDTLAEIIWGLEYSIGDYPSYPGVLIGEEKIDNPNDFDKLFYKNGIRPKYDWDQVKKNEVRCQKALELLGAHLQEFWD